MADDRADAEPLNVFDTLLLPLRLPGRVVGNIETLTGAVVTLQSDAKEHLNSVDERAGVLVEGLQELGEALGRIERKVDKLEEERMDAFLEAIGTLQGSIDRIERRVEELETLEETLTTRIDGLRTDLNDRMVEVKEEVRGMGPPMTEMAHDVAKIDKLLPDPKDGPLTRLKDTLTSA